MKSVIIKYIMFNGFNRIVGPVILSLLIQLLFSCANPVAPTGGPRDEHPPRVLRSTPDNYSANFEGQQVRIFFDEFIQIKELNQKFLISPPLEELPDVRVRGRSIVMDINEPLRDQTTYNFFFGDAIVDITEGNPMLNFQFVVSTGDFVDSLSIRGQVLDAFTRKPMEGVFVMLYDEPNDSLPYLERPVYISKTDTSGRYAINNMREGEYKIFALKDLNANFLYDLPEETIAFLDTLITPEFLGHPGDPSQPDEQESEHPLEGEHEHTHTQPALPPGQPTQPNVELPADTITIAPPATEFFSLFMFLEKDTVQRVVSSSLIRRGLIQLVFRIPADSAWVQEISQSFEHNWHIPEMNPGADTLRLWLSDVQRDTLLLQIGDGPNILDTLRLATTPRLTRGRQAAEEAPQLLNIAINTARTRGLPFFTPLQMTANNPLAEWDVSRIHLFDRDSIDIPLELEPLDHVQRVLQNKALLDPDQNYVLTMLPGAFTDIFGTQNDTLMVSFRTTLPDDYGTLILNLDLPHKENPFILQLLDKEGKLLQERTILADGIYNFRNLLPAEYGFRLIDDKNENGKWDTGHYLRAQQPEPVYIYPDLIPLRANWEMEVSWTPQFVK